MINWNNYFEKDNRTFKKKFATKIFGRTTYLADSIVLHEDLLDEVKSWRSLGYDVKWMHIENNEWVIIYLHKKKNRVK